MRPFLLLRQDAAAKVKRQWSYVLDERDGSIRVYAFFYILQLQLCCAAILIRLRRPTENTNRDAARERVSNALPGHADFEEAMRGEQVRVRLFLRCLPASSLLAFQVRVHNDLRYNLSRAAALVWSGDSDEDQEFAVMRRNEKLRSEAAVEL